MRKFTLYQAAKYSKISRYKLEQAIKEGLIKTVPGRGNIKCFLLENDLSSFLEKHADQYLKPSFSDDKKVILTPEIANFISKDIHEKMLAEKERIIKLLEFQNEKYLPLVTDSEKLRVGIERRFDQQLRELRILLEEALSLVPSSKMGEKMAIQERLNGIIHFSHSVRV